MLTVGFCRATGISLRHDYARLRNVCQYERRISVLVVRFLAPNNMSSGDAHVLCTLFIPAIEEIMEELTIGFQGTAIEADPTWKPTLPFYSALTSHFIIILAAALNETSSPVAIPDGCSRNRDV